MMNSHPLAAKVATETLNIYLLIGQSNMAGRAPYSEEEARPLPGVYLLNSENDWEPASNPMNRYSTIRKEISMQKMNPGYSFGQVMRAKQPDQTIGLVVNAQGGTSINQWQKGGEFYHEAIIRTRIALETGQLKGILWHQGETDANDPDYLPKLNQLITDLRHDLGAPNIPVVAGQINSSGDYLFNQIILELPRLVTNTAVVSNAGLTAMDQWHFDHDSMLTLGQRYAEKMQALQAKESKPGSE
ncbi:sialate O-acetylesterase [Coraliomargarita algicola]|uniref:Sialate O-acetylesterase n=1 Tax=Coraliomargarita algicola TaxID=3092156 RepID=A0ABZ0RHF6_9BACT|nr:sialate O-acetylesterase [Coraliomargarita sp. J2-16]WPJ95624.1 sialate O-acetylesterase [Coraliomargarita sp. J2-16]